jgi:predicted nucleic acid-binding protein
VRIVVADASPIHYLILIDAVHALSRLFEKVYVPVEVRNELVRERTPAIVRNWIERPPKWMEIMAAPVTYDEGSLAALDAGERAAILLAESIRADLLLIDERIGARQARTRGLAVTGTLGLLELASKAGLLRLRDVFPRLQKTNFRYPIGALEKLLDEERNR